MISPNQGSKIVQWTHGLLELLKEVKPEHEVYVFGISRVPKVPSYLLGSTNLSITVEEPLPITVTPKTADLFLGKVQIGVRYLHEELPLTMLYASQPDGKRVELQFYEAVCFDAQESSLVLALLLSDLHVNEYLTTDEISILAPLVRTHAIPLLELHVAQVTRRQLDDEMKSMIDFMRSQNPELARGMSGPPSMGASIGMAPKVGGDSGEMYENSFLQYIVQELRDPMKKLQAAADKQFEQTRASGSALHDNSVAIKQSAELQTAILKSLNNLTALAQPEVKPRTGAFSMQGFMREVYPLALEYASRHKITMKVDERTRNIYVAADKETVLKMMERLLDFMLPFAEGGQLWIRSDDSPEKVNAGFVAIEFEDSGAYPKEIPLAQLLNRSQVGVIQHPRLKRGGGILFQVLSKFLEKCAGSFKLITGEHSGFTARFVLPLVSRAEMERIRAGDVGSRSSDINTKF